MQIFDGSKHRIVIWDKVTGVQVGVNILPSDKKSSLEVMTAVFGVIKLKEEELKSNENKGNM